MASATLRGLLSIVDTTVTECPGRSRLKSYSAPRARATSARSVAGRPASARTVSSVSPLSMSRDQVERGGSIVGKEVSATEICKRGMGLGNVVGSAPACAIRGGSDTKNGGGWRPSGVHMLATARPGGTGSFDQIPEIARPPPDSAATTPKPAAIALILMLPSQFLLRVRGESSAPRIPLTRDSRSW